MKALEDEVSTEVTHPSFRPFDGCRRSDECLICRGFDELHCSRGTECVDGKGVIIGDFLECDEETGRDRSCSVYLFQFASLPGKFFCEDCACEMEDEAKS